MYEKLVEIVKEYIDVDVTNITYESDFMLDLGIDSFTLSEIACAVEDEFDIEIPDKKVHELKTVGDVVKFLEEITE